jgi:hypothetical protein
MVQTVLDCVLIRGFFALKSDRHFEYAFVNFKNQKV